MSLIRTELGSLVYLIQNPKTMDKSEWDYFRIAPHIDARLIPQEDQPLIYEPIALVRSISFDRLAPGQVLTSVTVNSGLCDYDAQRVQLDPRWEAVVLD